MRDLAALASLVRLFRQSRFAAIQSVTPKAGLLSMLAGWLARVPVRIHIFTGQVWATRRGFTRWFLKLMDRSGVAGIALAATLAVALSTCVMLLLFHRLGHITWVDMIMIALSWMLYTTLIICLHYHSYPGVVVSVLALLVLLYGQWNVIVRWRPVTQ